MSNNSSANVASLREGFKDLYLHYALNKDISLSDARTQARKLAWDAMANKVPSSRQDSIQLVLDMAEAVDRIFESKSHEDVGNRFDLFWKQEWV